MNGIFKTTLSTVALIAIASTWMMQCCYGTDEITLRHWLKTCDDNADSLEGNATYDDNSKVLTLSKYKKYILNFNKHNETIENISKLIIPDNVEFSFTADTANSGTVAYLVLKYITITNQGTFKTETIRSWTSNNVMKADAYISLRGGKIDNNGYFENRGIIGVHSLTKDNKLIDSEIVNNSTFKNLGEINLSTKSAKNSVLKFSGTGTILNEGKIYLQYNDNNGTINKHTIEFSGGSIETYGSKDGEGNIKYASIYSDIPARFSPTFILNSNTTLSFGEYSQFYTYSDWDSTSVTLNGILNFTSPTSEFYNLNIKSGSGTIDMSGVRQYPDEYSADLKNTTDLHDQFHDIKLETSSEAVVYLPFNCQFSNVDLSNAREVYYTVLQSTEGVVINNGIIQCATVTETYGDYANNSLGITLPSDINKVHIKKRSKDNNSMVLSALISEMDGDQLKYNQSQYKLLTDDLSNAEDTIESNTTHTYNFGFIGTKAIAISPNEGAENTKAVFMGNNSGYTPDNPATISVAEVIFGANNSLFQFSYTYGKGIFSAATGNETILNTIPKGKTVKFNGGFTLGKGHTLIVKGTLIG